MPAGAWSTHLGCDVVWQADWDLFEDICYNSLWDRTGLNVAGPAPRGLDWFPVRIGPEGWVEVDLDHSQPDRRGQR